MTIVELAAVSLIAVSPQEFIEGAELGDATRYVAFESGGSYHAEKNDKEKGGKTVLKGKWVFTGDNLLEVKQTACTGKECKALQHPYKVEIAVVAERAMTLKTIPNEPMLPTGSYYCRFQGCEQRIGIELLSKNAPASTMNYILDYAIDKNRKRDQTVVWWGKKLQTDAGASRIETCSRDPERAKKGAELMQADLAELQWVGKLEIKEVDDKECLWDVRVVIADTVKAPGRFKRADAK